MSLDEAIRNHLQSLASSDIKNWSGVESILTNKVIKKNEFFFQHFDHCDEVAIVKSGLFRIYLTDQEGEEKTYSFMPEHSFILDFFLSWEENNRAKISVQALEDSEILVFKYIDFVSLMKKESLWSEIYREVLLRNYIFKTKREIEFVQFNAKERLSKFIQSQRIDVTRIPKTHLASYLGIQPPSLSRLLRELKNDLSEVQ